MNDGILVLGHVITLAAVIKSGVATTLGGIAMYRVTAKVWSRVASK
ncbi:hypothetical protein [Nocardioides caldifontis]|nr:hypothetical protein [Nocardioides caldifontis]